MTKADQEKLYHIYVEHANELKKGSPLKIDIRIKLTDQEKKLMDRQQLQVNESIMLESGWAKTISYTHMIEHIITEVNSEGIVMKDLPKVDILCEEPADKEALDKYFQFWLWETEKNILKQQSSDDVIQKAKDMQEEIDNK